MIVSRRATWLLGFMAVCGCAAPVRAIESPELTVPPLPSAVASPSSASATPPPIDAPTPVAPSGPPAAPTIFSRTTKLALDPALVRKLHSGIPYTLDFLDGAQPVAQCSVQYDLWDEDFIVRRSPTRARKTTLEKALNACLTQPSATPLTVVEH